MTRPVTEALTGSAARHPTSVPHASPVDALAAGQAAFVRRVRVADTETAVSAALKLIEPERGDFLLESVEGGEVRGRYSLLGLAPDLVLRVNGDRAEINRAWVTDRDAFRDTNAPPLDVFATLLAEIRADVPADLPPALPCLVGYFAFEALGLIERTPRAKGPGLGLPDLLFVRPTVLLVFDRLADRLHLVAPLWPDGSGEPTERVDRAQDALDEVERRLDGPLPPPTRLLTNSVEPCPVMPAARYEAMVDRAQELIAAGDIFQVVLAQRFTADFPLPPLELYRSLRRVNPSPFLYHLDLPGFALIGSSPEILVRVRDGQVTVRPIAGTRRRGADEAEDQALEADLRADPKENAEHLMLLDLGRNDVARVSEGGSVKVTGRAEVERYSHVMHIVSNVVGRLRKGVAPLEALFAGFPAGTVSGAPKLRACEIVAELEAEARGPYGGGVGYFAPDGSFDSCIVLRTAVVQDGVMHVQAGAGVVADSVPAAEGRECAAKASALFAAARDARDRAAEQLDGMAHEE